MFYNFRQNSSFGRWVTDENLTTNVIIEADNAEQANARAEALGIYFDGCDDDIDCPCCGDRWYPVSEFDAEETPSIYGEPASDWKHAKNRMIWNNPDVIIHHADGTKTTY